MSVYDVWGGVIHGYSTRHYRGFNVGHTIVRINVL